MHDQVAETGGRILSVEEIQIEVYGRVKVTYTDHTKKLEVFREDIPRAQFQCQQTKLFAMHAHNYTQIKLLWYAVYIILRMISTL